MSDKSVATFYHAGCSVCVSAEHHIANAIDLNRYELNVIHLGDRQEKISEARDRGVRSVPALVLDGQPFHINFGAALDDLA